MFRLQRGRPCLHVPQFALQRALDSSHLHASLAGGHAEAARTHVSLPTPIEAASPRPAGHRSAAAAPPPADPGLPALRPPPHCRCRCRCAAPPSQRRPPAAAAWHPAPGWRPALRHAARAPPAARRGRSALPWPRTAQHTRQLPQVAGRCQRHHLHSLPPCCSLRLGSVMGPMWDGHNSIAEQPDTDCLRTLRTWEVSS